MTRYGSTRTTYPNLREVLDTQYANLPAAEIRSLMERTYGPGAAENYEEYFEGIFDDIGKFVAKAAPVVANVGGGVLKGAMAGSSLGLPGIIAGAAAGGAGTALQSYGKGSARDIGGALSGLTSIAGQFSPLGRVGASIGPAVSGLSGTGGKGAAGAAAGALGGLLGGGAGGGPLGGALGPAAINALSGFAGRSGAGAGIAGALGSLLGGGGAAVGGSPLTALTSLFGGNTAAGQLLSLLDRPEAKAALAALKLPEVGRKTIPVGSAQTPLPVTALPNLIRHLSEQIVAEAAALADGAESEPRYMMDAEGEWVGDPALERDRAARAWDLLNAAQAERLAEALLVAERESIDRADEAANYGGREQRIADYYDAIDLARSYALPAEDWESDFPEFDAEDLLGEGYTSEDYSELEEGEPYELT